MTTIFLFPFAGANCYSYNPLLPAGDANTQYMVLELPGRGRRMDERLLTRMDDMVTDVLIQLHGRLRPPYAFYGHSMGAIMAYLAAVRIAEDSALSQPVCLFLSGRQAPPIPMRIRTRHNMPMDELTDQLREMGGMPEAALADRDLMEFVEPILRADFEAIEKYEYRPAPRLQIPFVVMTGTEEDITKDEAAAWQEVTLPPVEVRQFEGDHFFIFRHPRAVMNIIQSRLNYFTCAKY